MKGLFGTKVSWNDGHLHGTTLETSKSANFVFFAFPPLLFRVFAATQGEHLQTGNFLPLPDPQNPEKSEEHLPKKQGNFRELNKEIKKTKEGQGLDFVRKYRSF